MTSPTIKALAEAWVDSDAAVPLLERSCSRRDDLVGAFIAGYEVHASIFPEGNRVRRRGVDQAARQGLPEKS